jgi:hypothetical protein
MSDSWEAEVFRIPDLAWQTRRPPDRYPIPVTYAPDVEVGDEVTIGVPGQYFIDGQVVASAERKRMQLPDSEQEQDVLAVAAPFAYWLAKGYPRAGLTMQWWPVKHCWIYRDAAAPTTSDVSQPVDERPAESWLDHVQSTLDQPPVRRPVPARAAGPLTGRAVRLQHERGAWSWWIATSEPADMNGDFLVHVMPPSSYWLTQAASDPGEQAHVVPLHRLYTYG